MTFGGWATNDFGVGEDIFVVGRYSYIGGAGSDDTCDLWVNPPPSSFGGASPPAAAVSAVGAGGSDITPIDRFFFRSGGSTSNPEKLVSDEIRVGFTWADVTSPYQPPLSITRNGTFVTVSWPTNPPTFTLQSAASLAAPVVWSNPAGSQVANGTNYTMSVGTTNATRYFRLAR
jgi:hypothetical protein